VIPEQRRLRVAIVSEREDLLAQIVRDLGHDVVNGTMLTAGATRPDRDRGDPSLDDAPEVMLVSSDAPAGGPRRHAPCPVISLIGADAAARTAGGSEGRVFAQITETTADETATALKTTLERFAAYDRLHGPSGDRAAIEQATGILMFAHKIAAPAALEILRDHADHDHERLVAAARALIDSHLLLAIPTAPGAPRVPRDGRVSRVA
jgi:hypothetical protein